MQIVIVDSDDNIKDISERLIYRNTHLHPLQTFCSLKIRVHYSFYFVENMADTAASYTEWLWVRGARCVAC